MIVAPIPLNESARLSALNRLCILDTPTERRFDVLTRRVCNLLRVPAAAISFVSGDRQWFKSNQGLTSRETSRSVSFCSHTILQKTTLVVPNASADPRFHDNPLVTGPEKVMAYAGHPLLALDGTCIGAISALDHKPHLFSPEDCQSLARLAILVEAELRTIPSEVHREMLSQHSAPERRSFLDPLTAIWNRSGILALLDREIAEALRTTAPLGLVLAQIDNFPHAIDAQANSAADDILREVARRLVSSIRPIDAVGRLTPELFLIIAPYRDQSKVIDIAELVRIKMSATSLITQSATFPLTVCTSVLSELIPQHSRRFEAKTIQKLLLKNVKETLSQTKAIGTNRIGVAPETFAAAERPLSLTCSKNES